MLCDAAVIDLAEDMVDRNVCLKPEYEQAALKECAHILIPRGDVPERYLVDRPLVEITDFCDALEAALKQGKEVELFTEW